jgi:hypothetical protein
MVAEPMPDDREQKSPGPEPGGPPDTQFLDLELTKVLYGEAEGLAREAARDILREALRARLRERLGARLEALAHIAADALADEVETNLRVEALIQEQRGRKRDVEERVRSAMSGNPSGSSVPRETKSRPRRGAR